MRINFFQYAITVALNHQNIGNNLERTSKFKPFINQYNWKDINIQEDCEKNKILGQLLLISYLYHTIQKQ